jgi:hypothetical protein
MATIDYSSLFFTGSVHLNGGHKQTRISASPGRVRLYRDMETDPFSVVIHNVSRGVRDIVPWSHVETARPLGAGSVVQPPSVSEPENGNADEPDVLEPEAPVAEAAVATRSVNAAGEPVVTLPSKPAQRGGKR